MREKMPRTHEPRAITAIAAPLPLGMEAMTSDSESEKRMKNTATMPMQVRM